MKRTKQVLWVALLALFLSPTACTFDPHPDLARYEACGDDRSCVDGCSCLEKWWVCAPNDPKAKPESCRAVEPECRVDEGCDDGNPCTDDSCVAGDCQHEDVEDYTPCEDDDPANPSECRAGTCVPVACNSATDCDDVDPCTDDACVDGACIHDPVADEMPCDDSVPETLSVCRAGTCTPVDCIVDTDCSGVCYVSYSCNNGNCEGVGGMKDEDGDGYITVDCEGGDDCDDSEATVNPGGWEGPYGDPTCSNGLNDDCENLIDHQAPGCQPYAGACNLDGWCWENPLPTGNTINDFWFDGEVLWAVGDAGTILRWDGLTWDSFSNLTHVDLNAVWGCSGHVWVFGDGGYISHREGEAAFSLVAEGNVGSDDLLDAWGRSCDEIWVVGRNGVVLEREGASWKPMEGLAEFDAHLYAIWGQADSFWVAGEHFGGFAFLQRWTSLDGWQGTVSNLHNELTSIRSLWVSPEGTIWLGGNGGIIGHSEDDGGSWDWMDTSDKLTILSIHGDGEGMIYAVDEKGSLWWVNAPSNPPELLSDEVPGSMHALWAQRSDRVFVGGVYGRMAVYDGQRCRRLTSGERANLNAISGAQVGGVWAVGEGDTILRREGSNNAWVQQTEIPAIGNLFGIVLTNDLYVFIVGQDGQYLWRHAQEAWRSDVTISQVELFDLASANNEIVAVGAKASIMGWQRPGFFDLASSPVIDADLNAVSLYSESEGAAVGDEGAIFQGDSFSGAWEWEQVFHDQQADWSDVAMPPGGTTWVVGKGVDGGPKIVEISGLSIVENTVQPGTEQPLTTIWVANYLQILVAGDPDGAIGGLDEQTYVGLWTGSIWSTERPGCKVGLTDLWDDGSTLFAVGKVGTVLSRPLIP